MEAARDIEKCDGWEGVQKGLRQEGGHGKRFCIQNVRMGGWNSLLLPLQMQDVNEAQNFVYLLILDTFAQGFTVTCVGKFSIVTCVSNRLCVHTCRKFDWSCFFFFFCSILNSKQEIKSICCKLARNHCIRRVPPPLVAPPTNRSRSVSHPFL